MRSINVMLAELLEALTAQIRAKGREDDYCSITVQPGNAVVFDFGPESGCKGSAWVRLVAANPTASFPAANVGINNCAYSLAFICEVGMIAPAPVLEDHLGNLSVPDDTELFDAAMRQAEEMQMMFDAIRAADIPEKVLGDYTPQGPDGGVLGGTWTVTIGGDD
jgi:hypothetical protein